MCIYVCMCACVLCVEFKSSDNSARNTDSTNDAVRWPQQQQMHETVTKMKADYNFALEKIMR